MPDSADDVPATFERADSVADVLAQVVVLNTALATQDEEVTPADLPDEFTDAEVQPTVEWLRGGPDDLFDRVKRIIDRIEANMATLANSDDIQSYTISVGMSVSGPAIDLAVTYGGPGGDDAG